MDFDAIVILDFISTFAFAWVGARVTASKNLDYGGILFIAGVSAMVFVLLYQFGQDSLLSALISGLIIVMLRLPSFKLKINLPKLSGK